LRVSTAFWDSWSKQRTLRVSKKGHVLVKEIYTLSKNGQLWIISPKNGNGFKVEIGIENYGLYVQRSGSYNEEIGYLVESLTGQYGKIEIEDL